MRVSFRQSAEEHERYMPHAFDRLIGQEVPFKINDQRGRNVTIVAVEVDEDGRGATWTVDIADGMGAHLAKYPIPGLSASISADQGMSFKIPPAIPARGCEHCQGYRCPCTCTDDCGTRADLRSAYCPRAEGYLDYLRGRGYPEEQLAEMASRGHR